MNGPLCKGLYAVLILFQSFGWSKTFLIRKTLIATIIPFIQHSFVDWFSFFFSYDRISIFEISCVPIFRQNAQHYFFWTKFAQKWILRLEIQKTNVWKRISIFEILCVPIFRQNGLLWLLGPNLPKNGFWGPSFKNLSRDSESEPLKNYVSKFSVK